MKYERRQTGGGGPQNLKLTPPDQDASNILVALDADCPLVGTISFSPGSNPYAGLTIDCALRAAVVDLTGRIAGGRVTGVTENVIPDPDLENYDLEIHSSKLATPFPMPPVGHLIFDGINTCTALSSNKKLPFSLTVAASSFTTFSFGVDSYFADPATIGLGSIEWNLADQPFGQASLNALVEKADACGFVCNLDFTGTGYVEPGDPPASATRRLRFTSNASEFQAPGEDLAAHYVDLGDGTIIYFIVDSWGVDPAPGASVGINLSGSDNPETIAAALSQLEVTGWTLAADPDDAQIVIFSKNAGALIDDPGCEINPEYAGFEDVYNGFAGGASQAVARIISRGGTVVY